MSETLTNRDVAPASGYAGDISSKTAWSILQDDPAARLIDVRTTAEWSYVGVPDLSDLGRQVIFLEWQSYPSMAQNPDFVARLSEAVSDTRGPLLFICRSGQRSAAAARTFTQTGRDQCFNVSDGFEGPADLLRRRGTTRGWKAAGLPWTQG